MTRLEILCKRYLTSSCTPEEEAEFFELLNKTDNPEVRKLLYDVWESPFEKLSSEQTTRTVNSILPQKVVPIEGRSFSWLKAAAITAILAIAGVGLYQFVMPTERMQPSRTAEVLASSKFMKLPDGSKIILNGDSKLKFPASFEDKKTREVILVGEAYFDIVHDATKPFIVRTGQLSTTVLGTAFNIKAYPDQSDITVTVTRGKVSVSNEAQVLGILSPDDQITFNKSDQQSKLVSVKSDEVHAWRAKDISFDNVTMAEAAEELNERFDVTIKFKNTNIMNCRFTATFIRGEDLDQILHVICEFNKADYSENEDGVIEVSGEGCVD
jgi:transmembrane sensor